MPPVSVTSQARNLPDVLPEDPLAPELPEPPEAPELPVLAAVPLDPLPPALEDPEPQADTASARAATTPATLKPRLNRRAGTLSSCTSRVATLVPFWLVLQPDGVPD